MLANMEKENLFCLSGSQLHSGMVAQWRLSCHLEVVPSLPPPPQSETHWTQPLGSLAPSLFSACLLLLLFRFTVWGGESLVFSFLTFILKNIFKKEIYWLDFIVSQMFLEIILFTDVSFLMLLTDLCLQRLFNIDFIYQFT